MRAPSAGPVLTCTLNPALDTTYRVARLDPGDTVRVASVVVRAGGKGVNVARVLHRLGTPVLATGLAGGADGSRLTTELDTADVPHRFIPIAGHTRRTVVIHEGHGRHTGLWEPGPQVTAAEWVAFRDQFVDLLSATSVVVLSGSLPPGVPRDAYAVLVRAATTAGVPVVLDADGEALRAGLAARPDVVKPNLAEAAAVAGESDPALAAAALRAAGARCVLLSRGPDGMLADTPDGRWSAVAPVRHDAADNPTGAGDAAVAAVASGLRAGHHWRRIVRDATALSAAAVAEPQAGAVDLALYRRHLASVHCHDLPPAPGGCDDRVRQC